MKGSGGRNISKRIFRLLWSREGEWIEEIGSTAREGYVKD